MFELPVESRFKYGKFDDDVDDFAVELSGGKPAPRRASVPSGEAAPRGDGQVDEDFLRSLIGNPEGKYGR